MGASVYVFSFQSTPTGEVPVSLLTDDGSGTVQVDNSGNGYISTDNDGNFDITGFYEAECPTATAPVYILGVGGDIGYGYNGQFVEMAAMPVSCSQLPNASLIEVNELTTIAAAYAFSNYAWTPANDQFTAPNTSEDTLNSLFAYANDIVSGFSGNANSSMPDGGAIPIPNLNTLGNILTTCTRTSGGDPCQTLFDTISEGSSTAEPQDTLIAAVQIAQSPAANVSDLYGLAPKNGSLYQPVLSAAPADWTLPVAYTPSMAATVNLSSNEDPSYYGDPVSLIADITVTNSTSSTAGVVYFYEGNTLLGSGKMSGSGGTYEASIVTSSLVLGPHQITAFLIGAGLNATSNSYAQIVLQANSSTSLQGTPNPATYGAAVVLTTTVCSTNTSAAGVRPTGTATFFDGSTQLGAVALSNGTASLTVSNFTAGTHNLTVRYGGDANYAGSTSSSYVEVILGVATATTVGANPNPAYFGQGVTLTANVSGSNPTGTVTFFDGGATIQAQTVSSGSAAILDSSLAPGTHNITATYSGDAGNQTSTSSPLQVIIQNNPTTTTVALLSPQTYAGSPIVATVTVTDSAGVTPVGTVTCTNSGASGTPFTGTLSNGSVTWTNPVLPIGSYQLACTYSGSTGYASSTSASVTATVIAVPPATWTQNGNMTTPRDAPSGTLLNDGTVLIAGGYSSGGSNGNNTALNSGEIYDPIAGTFAAITSGTMSTGRVGHTATLLPNGQVLLAGGETGTQVKKFGVAELLTATADLYDPASHSFIATGSMSNARGGATATLLQDGTVLIVGGTASSTPAEIYSDGTFTTTGAPTVPRSFHTATLLPSGKVLITGGSSNGVAVSSAETYDPGCSCFTATSSGMSVARMSQTATLLPNGTVAVVGGSSDGINGLSSAEIYDPTTNSFMNTLGNSSTTQIGSLNTGRLKHNAAILNNGMLLITGGANPTPNVSGPWTPLASSELFDANTGQFTTTTSQNQARELAAAVLLDDGTLFVAGGLNAAPNSPSTTETFLSSTETYAPPSMQGGVDLKWVILNVIYAPPGGASFATYTNSVSQGTTITIADSFSQDENISVSIGKTIKAFGTSGGVTASSSSDFTQSSQGTIATTLSKQASFALPIGGVPDSFNPVNHNYDIVWLWLNPVGKFTVDPTYPAHLTWNGFGFDSQAGGSDMKVYPVYVGQLNGTIAFSQADLDALSRSWDKNSWPSGQGPGLTQADFDQIIKFDPFANCTYSNTSAVFTNCTDPTENTGGGNFPTPLPRTSADGRYTEAPGLDQNIVYQQAVSGSTPRATVYTETTTNQTQTMAQNSTTVKQQFTLEEKFNFSANLFGAFVASLNFDLKQSDTLMWNHTSTQSTTVSNTNTSSFSITGPTCAVFGNGCSPNYSGPPGFNVYQDNKFGTFLFYPTN